MVVETFNPNTREATDQWFEIIYDYKVSSRLAWDTQKPVSKTNKQTKKQTNKQASIQSREAKGNPCQWVSFIPEPAASYWSCSLSSQL
jgi:valyl-tRNA synthetase